MKEYFCEKCEFTQYYTDETFKEECPVCDRAPKVDTHILACLCGTELVVVVPKKYNLTKSQVTCPVCSQGLAHA